MQVQFNSSQEAKYRKLIFGLSSSQLQGLRKELERKLQIVEELIEEEEDFYCRITLGSSQVVMNNDSGKLILIPQLDYDPVSHDEVVSYHAFKATFPELVPSVTVVSLTNKNK